MNADLEISLKNAARNDHSRMLLIMRGLPGSGKSTLVDQIARGIFNAENCQVCSADSYFLTRHETGLIKYVFDPKKLTEAHTYCFERSLRAMHSIGAQLVVVDNTNLSRAEYTPYVMLGRTFNYDVIMARMDCPPEICTKRNVHGVPAERFEDRQPHDPIEYVINTR